ncbi:YecA family protein, partial [Vibrio parahaemolyticus]|nr:YecA family protein [Vibrio parahaemolyticus]
MKLQDILSLPELDGKLLNLAKTQGFVTAMAAAPN